MDGFYTILIIIQFLLELLLFILAVCTVKWPKGALVRSEETQAKNPIDTVSRVKSATQPQTLGVRFLAGPQRLRGTLTRVSTDNEQQPQQSPRQQ